MEGTLPPIENHYFGALFCLPEKNLRAGVIFPVTCKAQRGSLGQPVAFSVFDDEGLVIKSYENRGEKFLLDRISTSASLTFTVA